MLDCDYLNDLLLSTVFKPSQDLQTTFVDIVTVSTDYVAAKSACVHFTGLATYTTDTTYFQIIHLLKKK